MITNIESPHHILLYTETAITKKLTYGGGTSNQQTNTSIRQQNVSQHNDQEYMQKKGIGVLLDQAL